MDTSPPRNPIRATIEQLRYVRLGTPDLDAATDFATRVLGLQAVRRDEDQAWFRSDSRDHTLCYVRGVPTENAVGIELRDADALGRAEQELHVAGLHVTRGDTETNAARRVLDHVSVEPEPGLCVDLVVRPLHSGWRYFPSRDAGITGFHGVALRTAQPEAALAFWTGLLSARVSDWVGQAAYLRTDSAHHRLALYPSRSSGVLEVQFQIEGVDQVMQNSYWLRGAQVPIVHGPGRRPASQQAFLSCRGPDGMLFGFVAEGSEVHDRNGGHLPRQFRHAATSFCAWGSRTDVPEWHSPE